MFVEMAFKQRRAASVVHTALVGAGLYGRAIAVHADSWLDEFGRRENYAVFVSAPDGANTEPFYVTGKTITEAVRNMLSSIKGNKTKNGTDSDNQPEKAPF
jgi:hypothetical protein